MRNKKILIFILFSVLISASAALSRAVWMEGKVTRAPWMVDSHYNIEVNKITYNILSDIRITYRYMRNEGAYDEKNVQCSCYFYRPEDNDESQRKGRYSNRSFLIFKEDKMPKRLIVLTGHLVLCIINNSFMFFFVTPYPLWQLPPRTTRQSLLLLQQGYRPL